MIVKRYQQLFGIPTLAVRVAPVYGPLDRETWCRHVQSVPWMVANLAVAGEELRVDGYDAVGDWIHAADVAQAIALLLRAPTAHYWVYNLATGRAETVKALLDIVAERIPVRERQVPTAEANVVCDSERRFRRGAPYDVSRMRNEFGWQAAPLRQRMHEYIDWLLEQRSGGTAAGERET